MVFADASQRKCFVTGARGYLGREIVSRLRADHWHVIELNRSPEGDGVRFELGDDIDPRVLGDGQALVHCAYDFRPVSWRDVHAVNVAGSLKLLRAAHAAGIERLVFISTISAFDGCRSLYGRGKLEVEAAVRALGGAILRPGLVYGPRPGGLFNRVAKQVRASPVIPLPDGGWQRQYLAQHEDVAAAVSAAVKHPRSAHLQPVTVAHSTPWTLRAIVNGIASALGRRIVIVPTPWRAMWTGLRVAELIGLPLGMRSDSLISLMHQDPTPRLNVEQELGVAVRPFDPTTLDLNIDSAPGDR